jgi:hypothetical protein
MININGMSFTGSKVQITNNKIYIDGKLLDESHLEDAKVFNIIVDGPLSKLDVENAESIEIKGDVGSVKTTNGNVQVSGSVNGDVKTVNGNVNAINIDGKVSTVNGNINEKWKN